MRHILAALAIGTCISCAESRTDEGPLPTYREDVAPILNARCLTCHTGKQASAGYRVDNYGTTIGCNDRGEAVTLNGSSALFLRALERPDHASRLEAREIFALKNWVLRGTPSTTGGVHPPTFADPRTSTGHARFLRERLYRPLRDPNDADACMHCHDGASREGPKISAPGATPCTTCHTEPGGVSSCSTCHGVAGLRDYPPRDPCFFPEAKSTAGAHARHAGATATRAEGLACSTCHPTPNTASALSLETHMNTHVEVHFDYQVAGASALYEPRTTKCTGTCHARSGTTPEVLWRPSTGPAACGSCHGSPPKEHYAGACSGCHREANENGTSLENPVLHVNGRVDVGDGSGTCSACHGANGSPWPRSGAHASHASPKSARAVACETCHALPQPGEQHPRGGGATVRLSGLAVKGGARASYDAQSKTCSETYCHTGRGGAQVSPVWALPSESASCSSCHAVPPPPPHTTNTSCGASGGCHQGSLSAPNVFTANGKNAHVDGFVTRGLP